MESQYLANIILDTMKSIFTFLFVFISTCFFAQTEPTWMRFPAISPDGKTIAFCYHGDVFTVSVEGGVATPITISEAYEKSPVWSPDGKSIAFASDRHGNFDVFIVNASGGAAQRLTYNSAYDQPTDFTPDGKEVIFTSVRMDTKDHQQFPTGAMPELYKVGVSGGREIQLLTTPALEARFNADGSKLIYQDQKGYEDEFRKHHTSSVTRDIWVYDFATKSHAKISTFNGEDLDPEWSADGKSVFYLSEQNGSMNIYKTEPGARGGSMLTSYKEHPVRCLSRSNNDVLCYTYHGEIFTLREGSTPQKVKVKIVQDDRFTPEQILPVSNVNDFALSPNGKEIAFIFRGEVFVASTAEGTTKRITSTPEQERNIEFSPDGRSLIYSSERGDSWNIYRSSIIRKEEPYFFTSTILKEDTIIATKEETFQPQFSPDGKEIAFLEERTALRVINLETKAVRTIVPANKNYSYADGDQFYEWSPDGKWFLVSYLPGNQWISQAGLVSADGKGEVKNLTESGYGAQGPRWMMNGKMVMWSSSRNGLKNHASWGAQSDVYASFLTQEAYDVFKMTKEEFEIYTEEKAKLDIEKAKKEEESKSKKSKDKSKEEAKGIEPLKMELDGFKDRKVRLTIHSSNLSDAYVSKDGSNLYYLAEMEKGVDLWQTDLRTKETKILAKLGTGYGSIFPDSTDKFLFVVANGTIMKIDVATGEPKPVAVHGEMVLNESAERAYLFEHIWRQVLKKFYVVDLQGVDWTFYKQAYKDKVLEVNNNYDFADMMGEMLGELNASHTGAFYRGDPGNGDATACLGFFYDENFKGNGLKITEVIQKNPLVKEGSKIKVGIVIEKIDGVLIESNLNYYPLLNRKAGNNVLLGLYNPATSERWEEVVKPISRGYEMELLYHRWVANCEHIVDSLSNGKVGYVHVRGMDDESFRKVYEDALGKFAFKEALVVDTRFNGGGWLHDDLATFLSGEKYISVRPRDQDLGTEPMFKWSNPSVVVMNESNYSDAHLFPFTYKELGVGKLVGMPVAGTGTAVWWEGLQNGVVFGIPQVGMVSKRGEYMENTQLEPDFKVENKPETATAGRDEQLEKAVQVLLNK